MSDKENIAKITLNRPEKMNPFSLDVFTELNNALDQAENDNDIRAVIITGAGKAFSAGVDLKELNELDPKAQEEFSFLGQKTFSRVEQFPKAVIAAVNGYAFGGGMELMLACDLRVASEDVKLGMREVKIGLIPAWGGLQRLPYLVGMAKAREMILTGNTYTAAEAQELGLFNKVVPADELSATAAFLAANIADNAPLAVNFAKQSLNLTRTLSLDDGYLKDLELAAILKDSKDFAEGVAAFFGKRKAAFTGE